MKTTTKFKPMKSIMWEKDKCTFPKMMSRKLDGVRCEVMKEGLFACSLKPIKNKNLTEYFKELLDLLQEIPDDEKVVLEAEIHCKGMKRNEINSVVNSHDAPIPEGFYLALFDLYYDGTKYASGGADAMSRYEDLLELQEWIDDNNLEHINKYHVIPQTIVNSVEEVEAEFEKALAEGDEGLILKDPEGLYKFGKSTVKEGLSLKVKPFETFDTECLEITQRFKNLNVSQKNELGQSFKRNTKDAKEATGIAATAITKFNGKQVSITLTGTEAERKEIWENRESYIGMVFEWKGMSCGMKDVPTHCSFVGWRQDKS